MTTVLIVEDQFHLRAIYSSYMAEHGLRVLTASDGESALEITRSQLPDIVVMDHSLPGRNGADVAQDLRANPATAGIPVIMVTAHAYGAVGRRARAAGCVSFLSKPCNPSRLLEEVRRFAPEPQTP